MKKKRMAVKRTAGRPLCEMELKVRERYSETHYGGKQPEICRHVANAMTFSTVFDRFRAPRSIEASASVESASKKRRSLSFRKYMARKQNCQNIIRAPKTAMRRFY